MARADYHQRGSLRMKPVLVWKQDSTVTRTGDATLVISAAEYNTNAEYK